MTSTTLTLTALASETPLKQTFSAIVSTSAVNDIVDHARQLAAILGSASSLPDNTATVLGELNDALAALPRPALDINQSVIEAGIEVICVSDTPGGDTETETDWLSAGIRYIVEAIHDEDGLLMPMIVLKDTTFGPVFAERFLITR